MTLALDPGCASPEVKVESRLAVAQDDGEAQDSVTRACLLDCRIEGFQIRLSMVCTGSHEIEAQWWS